MQPAYKENRNGIIRILSTTDKSARGYLCPFGIAVRRKFQDGSL